MITKRYWRLSAIDITWNNINGDKYWDCYEIKLFQSPDLSGIRLMPVAASASSVFPPQGAATYSAINAFDGNSGTRWASEIDAQEFQWISAEFATDVSLNSLSIETYATTVGATIPKKIRIECSDTGDDWNWKLYAYILPENTYIHHEIQAFYDVKPIACRPLISGDMFHHSPYINSGLLIRGG
jgi:hypothetical protein